MENTIKQIRTGEVEFLTEGNCYGFYDWFCKNSSLRKKGERLLKIALTLSKSPRIDEEKTGVFFKNNCPCFGSLYDDLRFVDLNRNVLYTIVPHSGHRSNRGNAEIWGKENDFEKPLFEGTWKDAKNWFLKK